MRTFVTGILRDNRRGATEDADHVLQLEHRSGQTLNVFCPPELCDNLEIDADYELIVRGTAFASADVAPDECLRYFETAAEGEFSGSEGRILHIGRVFRPRAFQSVRPALYQGRWLVLATQFGQMIVRSRILRPEGVALAVGGYLRYNGCRLDLYAVV